MPHSLVEFYIFDRQSTIAFILKGKIQKAYGGSTFQFVAGMGGSVLCIGVSDRASRRKTLTDSGSSSVAVDR